MARQAQPMESSGESISGREDHLRSHTNFVNFFIVWEEFFHIFNVLHDQGKQLLFTSDKSPNEIKPLYLRKSQAERLKKEE